MRLRHLNADHCWRLYSIAKKSVEEFEFVRQSDWFFLASDFMRLARAGYAIGNPLSEIQEWLRQATVAYRELFSLRGTTFKEGTRFENGVPSAEETIPNDGFTSVTSFNAALVCLSIQDVRLARELVELAGHSPSARFVSPKSQVCTTNQQTLSHALNALVASDMAGAKHEANKLSVRHAPQMERQIGAVIDAIASDGDVLTEIASLVSHHEKLAVRRDNYLDPRYWFCLPALGLTYFALQRGLLSRVDLPKDNVFFPVEILFVGL